MTAAHHRTVILEYIDAFNRGDQAALPTFFTPDALVWGVLGWGGMEKVLPIWRMLHESLAMELHVDAIIEQGDHVAVRFTERGTSVGTFLGRPATGKKYEVIAMEWFEMRDGKIHRRYGARDSASILKQLFGE